MRHWRSFTHKLTDRLAHSRPRSGLRDGGANAVRLLWLLNALFYLGLLVFAGYLGLRVFGLLPGQESELSLPPVSRAVMPALPILHEGRNPFAEDGEHWGAQLPVADPGLPRRGPPRGFLHLPGVQHNFGPPVTRPGLPGLTAPPAAGQPPRFEQLDARRPARPATKEILP